MKRVVVLIEIDGEGAVFNLDLISKGIVGGREAGLQLATGIRRNLRLREGRQLWVYVFLNRRRLDEALGSSDAKPQAQLALRTLSDFMVGFSQANQRFMIVDVGAESGAAYAKITALVEAETRLSQTEKIVLAGVEADRYKAFFGTLIKPEQKDKLVLLKTHDGDEERFSEFDLPMFAIEDLFVRERLSIPEKLVVAPPSASTVVSFAPSPPESPGEWTKVTYQKRRSRGKSVSGAASQPSTTSPKFKVLPNWTPRVDPGYVRLSIVACNFYYRSLIRVSIDRVAPELDILRAHLKRYEPCQLRLKGKICRDGSDCIYAHKCPYVPNCHYVKENRCWFKGEDMHTPDEKPPQEDDLDIDADLLNFPKETN
ncbi:hypothetical protein MD484_g5151, partial [Candolleomyces efflorescens]